MMLLADLLEELPEDLERQVFTHASWSERRSDSYTRLAFLGDSVLALAVTAHLYPRLEAERFGAGRLTKIRAQAVSGASCRAVAERLALPERLRAAAPQAARETAQRAGRDRARARLGDRGGDRRVLPACGLRAHRGSGRGGLRAGDRGGAGAPRGLQVGAAGAARAARCGGRATRSPASRGRRTSAPTWWRRVVDGRELGSGSGRSKKHAEQEAARLAVERLEAE